LEATVKEAFTVHSKPGNLLLALISVTRFEAQLAGVKRIIGILHKKDKSEEAIVIFTAMQIVEHCFTIHINLQA
jgi:hypothetical protein